MREEPLWPQLAAGLLLVAGALHLLLVPSHLGHARGAGLFFLLMGTAQIVWAVAYLSRPSANMRWIGMSVMALSPTVLYVLTRIWDAPWHGSPEAVDTIGVATQVAQLLAAVALFIEWRPQLLSNQTGAVFAMGLMIGMVSYAGAFAAEDVEWLAQAEEEHGHGEHDDHDDHAPIDDFGIRGQSVVGDTEYYGPATAGELLNDCRAASDTYDCHVKFLKEMLAAQGSIPAFDVLDQMMALNSVVDADGHAYAHDLGRFAYQAYGYDITLTLAECSYEVFQGCLHGALQLFFDDIAYFGQELDSETISSTCSGSKNDFESYACLHGLGHGVMLFTNYKLHESLDYCKLLPNEFQRGSCYGGVYMENFGGYRDSINPTAAAGHHGHGGHDEPPTFWVEPDIPEYPCNIVDSAYKQECWSFQTSLILYFNGGNFVKAKDVCNEKAGDHRLTCFRSIGRDTGGWTGRNANQMVSHCQADDVAMAACVAGFSIDEVLNYNDPYKGKALCEQLPTANKASCYNAIAGQTVMMWGAERTAQFCAELEAGYEQTCRDGARL